MVGRIFFAVVVGDGVVLQDAHVAIEEDEIDSAPCIILFRIVVEAMIGQDGAFVRRFTGRLCVFHFGKVGLDGGRGELAVHVSREEAGEAFGDVVHAGHDERGAFLSGLFAHMIQMRVKMDEFLASFLVLQFGPCADATAIGLP